MVQMEKRTSEPTILADIKNSTLLPVVLLAMYLLVMRASHRGQDPPVTAPSNSSAQLRPVHQ